MQKEPGPRWPQALTIQNWRSKLTVGASRFWNGHIPLPKRSVHPIVLWRLMDYENLSLLTTDLFQSSRTVYWLFILLIWSVSPSFEHKKRLCSYSYSLQSRKALIFNDILPELQVRVFRNFFNFFPRVLCLTQLTPRLCLIKVPYTFLPKFSAENIHHRYMENYFLIYSACPC